VSELHQVKVSVSDEYWQRYQDARTAGTLTNPSGLAKVAMSYANISKPPAAADLIA
jgi:hypothetical protein